GTNYNRIARLNTNGSLDLAFNPGTGANDLVEAVVVQPDGKIVIAGSFTNINGTLQNRIARLNDDGSLDLTFNPGSGTDGRVRCLTRQTDGRFLIGGDFNFVNATTRRYIARLNMDGSLDGTFNPGSGPASSVYVTAVQPDGKILVGGSFTTIRGTN